MFGSKENRKSLLLIALAAAPIIQGASHLDIIPEVQASACCWSDDDCKYQTGYPWAYCDYMVPGCYESGSLYQCKW
jgi:hypothetical protein